MSSSLFDSPPQDVPPVDDALRCNHPGCGRELSYSGRGRKPTKCDEHKRASSSTSSTRGSVKDSELTQACDSLAQLYDACTIPVAMLNPTAAGVWIEQVEGLNTRNRAILANNRDLVRKINAMGERGGNVAFILSHLVAVAPVAMVIVGHARINAADRRAAREQASGAGWESVDATDAAFVAGANGVGTAKDPSFFDVQTADPAS